MAIVFQSPKRKQRMFFALVVGLLAVLLVVLSLITFLPEINNQFKNFSNQDAISIPEVNIHFAAVDSHQAQNLQLFKSVGPEFSYTAKNSFGKQITGRISAASIEEARNLLQNMSLSINTLQEITIGRKDPFASY